MLHLFTDLMPSHPVLPSILVGFGLIGIRFSYSQHSK